jgi:hypothetical protein
MKTPRTGFCVLLTVLTLTVGCVTKDPLRGWKLVGSTLWGLRDTLPINKVILNDAHHFVGESAGGDITISRVYYFEGKSGQHALKLTSMFDTRYWNYVLIYDKDNARVKTIKYSSGRYSP